MHTYIDVSIPTYLHTNMHNIQTSLLSITYRTSHIMKERSHSTSIALSPSCFCEGVTENRITNEKMIGCISTCILVCMWPDKPAYVHSTYLFCDLQDPPTTQSVNSAHDTSCSRFSEKIRISETAMHHNERLARKARQHSLP